MQQDNRLLQLSPNDNIVVLSSTINAGENITIGGETVTINQTISMGHKLACKTISRNDKIIKYGAPIGSATQDIKLGEHVHTHNIVSDYTPTYTIDTSDTTDTTKDSTTDEKVAN